MGYHHCGQASRTCTRAADGTVTWDTMLSGSFDARWGSGWIQSGGNASLFHGGRRAAGEAGMHAFGGFTAGDGVVHLEDVTFQDAHPEGATIVACALSGVLQIKDPTGYWWRLALDGTCDACGQLGWEGVDGGELCLGEALVAPLRAVAEGTCAG